MYTVLTVINYKHYTRCANRTLTLASANATCFQNRHLDQNIDLRYCPTYTICTFHITNYETYRKKNRQLEWTS